MKIGDLVVVHPAKSSMCLIVGCQPERENNWPDTNGIPLGKLWELYTPEEKDIIPMHEKWIEVINE